MTLHEIWATGAILLGFELAALTWRINREIRIEHAIQVIELRTLRSKLGLDATLLLPT